MCPICKEFLEWPAESGPTDFGLINHRPERFSNSRTLNKIEKGGFIFHPSNEDLSPGTPDGKSHWAVVLSENSYWRTAIKYWKSSQSPIQRI